MIDLPSEPMLANPVETFALPLNWFAEPKWDGFRAFAAHDATGPTVLRSRTGSDLSAAFPEITSALRRLPFSVVFDGELVVWEENRLAFGRLTQRLHRRGAVAQQAAAAQPAHYVVFDLLHVEGQSLRERSYVERRRALETLFQREGLAAPWTLCPSTNDAEVARGWLAWSVAGVEGCVFKDGGESYRPGERSWRKFRVRDTLEMIVGAVTGAPHRPRTLLLGRHDFDGRLQYAGTVGRLAGSSGSDHGGSLAPGSGSPVGRVVFLRRLGITGETTGVSGRSGDRRRDQRGCLPGRPRPSAPPCALCAGACGHGRRRRAAPRRAAKAGHMRKKKEGSLSRRVL